MTIQRDWHKCYGESWTGIIVPDAFAHPAKFARGLIKRIYQHALVMEYLRYGDTVVDPFGGVALGALHAMRQGLHWHGVELEPRFVELGQQNIDLWNARFSALPRWGSARLMQGDSRRLCEVVGSVGGVVGSPPYECDQMGGGGNKHDKVIDAMKEGYGRTPGQLAQQPTHTFWSSARDIMAQCYQVLKLGGVAIWVVKSFVRNKQIVDFPDQWRRLGEACGFETLEWIRAHLVEDRGAQYDLFGELHEKKVERKSFFRRLAEKKGSPRIDYEIVLIQRRTQ